MVDWNGGIEWNDELNMLTQWSPPYKDHVYLPTKINFRHASGPSKRKDYLFIKAIYFKVYISILLFPCSLSDLLHSSNDSTSMLSDSDESISTCSDTVITWTLSRKSQLRILFTSLQRCGITICRQHFSSFFSCEGIQWNFTTAFAPWPGGFYERLIGMVLA